ncbi:hypothetical protein [Sphingomonas sp. S2-65]|uniref:hypothetical protein n=1 Tax=Sphingomonas sp. S2-65 TaxID=2903960 RepID=UPI001F3F0433|nr:hypothetical protein [Sphingomonas sp. S2-65]UYY59026.1 hypothetical protein LZ586_02685 [Sphingomonas sp. S2-65]
MAKRLSAQDLDDSAQRTKSLADAQELSLRASKLHRIRSDQQAPLLPFPLFRN